MSLPKLPTLPTLATLPASLPELPTLPSIVPGGITTVEPDPLAAVQYTGQLEHDADAELSATLQAFKDRVDREAERFRLATDSEYWFAVCFQTREQKEAFLHAMKWYALGDKYLDGTLIAKRLGVSLPAADVPYNTSSRVDPKLAGLT